MERHSIRRLGCSTRENNELAALQIGLEALTSDASNPDSDDPDSDEVEQDEPEEAEV